MARTKLSKQTNEKILEAVKEIEDLDYVTNVLYRAARRVYEKIYTKKCRKAMK